jgi:hypothetical protein
MFTNLKLWLQNFLSLRILELMKSDYFAQGFYARFVKHFKKSLAFSQKNLLLALVKKQEGKVS